MVKTSYGEREEKTKGLADVFGMRGNKGAKKRQKKTEKKKGNQEESETEGDTEVKLKNWEQ